MLTVAGENEERLRVRAIRMHYTQALNCERASLINFKIYSGEVIEEGFLISIFDLQTRVGGCTPPHMYITHIKTHTLHIQNSYNIHRTHIIYAQHIHKQRDTDTQ